MNPSMRTMKLLWLCIAFLVASNAKAASHPKPVEETFLTADGVRLKGRFHKSGKPAAGNPIAVLLYEPGLVALDGGQVAVALGGELVDRGQGVAELGQPDVLGQRGAPVVEAVDRRVVSLELEQGPLLGDRRLHQ